MADRQPLPFDSIEVAHRNWDEHWSQGATMAAAMSLVRGSQIVVGAVEGALRPFGLNFARYEALCLLFFSREGTLPLGKMGERLMIHPASVTNVIDRLEDQGLVVRVRPPGDRRSVLASLTADGRRVVKEATEQVLDNCFGLGGLSSWEVTQLTRTIRKLRSQHGEFSL